MCVCVRKGLPWTLPANLRLTSRWRECYGKVRDCWGGREERERETERWTQTDTETQNQRQRETKTEAERERERERERDRVY